MKRLLLLLFLLLTKLLYSQNEQLFDNNYQLSSSLINDICVDNYSFVWIATDDGLNRFDGHSFVLVGNNDNDSCLANKRITQLFLLDQKELYVGTSSGLFVFDYKSETFNKISFFVNEKEIFPHISSIAKVSSGQLWITTSGYGIWCLNPKESKATPNQKINDNLLSPHVQNIFVDSKDRIFISSYNKGFYVYLIHSDELLHFSTLEEAPFRILDNDITDFEEDNQNNIYVSSTYSGLIKFDNKLQSFQLVQSPNDPLSIPIKKLEKDSLGNIWVATDGYGLKMLPNNQNKLVDILPQVCDFNFAKSKIHSMYFDNIGNLWLGVYHKGLFLMPKHDNANFENFGYHLFGTNTVGSNNVSAICSTNQEVWMGSDCDGIYILNKNTKEISHINLKNDKNISIPGTIMSMYNYKDKYIFVGTYSDGLFKIDAKSKKILKIYRANADNKSNITNDKISFITSDKDTNKILLSTFGDGILTLDVKSDVFLSAYPHNIIEKPRWVNSIAYDKLNNYWVGTYDGLYYIDQYNKEQKWILTDLVVQCMYIDKKNCIFVGTNDGFYVISKQGQEIRHFTQNDGLCNNIICAFMEDDKENLYISTHNGLSIFDKNDKFTNFFTNDGLFFNEFARQSVDRVEDGIFFGGVKGATKVLFKDFVTSYNNIGVILTDLYIYQNKIQSVLLSDTIKIKEEDNVFSIKIASKEPALCGKQNYYYRLLNEDNKFEKFNMLDKNQQRINFNNLCNGTYTLEVYSTFRDKNSNVRKLTIIILPPWYKTIIAKILWIVLGIALIALMISYFYQRAYVKRMQALANERIRLYVQNSVKPTSEQSLDQTEIEQNKSKNQDDLFLDKIMNFITQNMSNSQLNVEMLCENMSISRVHLNRKLKDLTELSPKDFIKSMRMKHAAKLLKENKLSVSEVAYAVGYNNPAHFSSSFKGYYGVTPGNY